MEIISYLNKKETFSVTISIISTYADSIIIRYPPERASRLTSKFSNVIAIVNTANRSNQHSIQILLDLFTVKNPK